MSQIKEYIKSVVEQIKAMQENEYQLSFEKVRQEEILPKFAEIDMATQELINAYDKEYNDTIASLTEQLRQNKENAIATANKKKSDFEETRASTIRNAINLKAQTLIGSLEKQIDSMAD